MESSLRSRVVCREKAWMKFGRDVELIINEQYQQQPPRRLNYRVTFTCCLSSSKFGKQPISHCSNTRLSASKAPLPAIFQLVQYVHAHIYSSSQCPCFGRESKRSPSSSPPPITTTQGSDTAPTVWPHTNTIGQS